MASQGVSVGTTDKRSARGTLRLIWVAVALLVFGTTAQAETPAQSSAEQKVEELLKLLDDPDVKALLATKGKPVEDTAMGGSAADFQDWSDSVRAHLREVVDAVPVIPGELSRARSTIMSEINGRRPIGILAFFAAFAALGFGAELVALKVLGRAGRKVAEAGRAVPPSKRHHVIGRSAFLAIAPVVVFAAASIGTFLAFTWPPLLASLMLPMLFALIAWRLVTRVAGEVLGTAGAGDDRNSASGLLSMDADAAAFWDRRVAVFAGIFFAGWAAAGLMTILNFDPFVRADIIYLIGLGLLAVSIETVWRTRGRNRSHGHRSIRQLLLTAFLCLLWLCWVAGATIPLWLGIYALILPPIFRSTRDITRSFFNPAGDRSGSGGVVLEVLVERAIRLLVIALAAAWFATVVRRRAAGMMADEDIARMIRAGLGGVVILLAADLIWQIAKGLINMRVERAGRAGIDEAERARSGRLLTLLPILRNFLAVLIAAVAIMMALSQFGVAVGPLIAGAGIFGVAIGFGSQSLVKDVISGIFYMADDAFRVGEYVESGKYKGTVESFSLRSVRLRHGRGPIFTVPFGQLGAVQNGSRDWAIEKFIISVGYDADLILLKKLVKIIGASLLADPELGSQIIEPLKMKGVEKFGDYGIDVSFAMTTKPGQQSSIRRTAYVMIRQAFSENGIKFASPSVQVGNGDGNSASIAAATRDAMARKKAAEEAIESE
jgi:moderate conductance mechanosensitive channel